MPKISVIVPVYKVEKYLNRCVDSILNQTFKDFELILVDDGSPDNSPKICDEYAAKDSRVHVIHKENGGQAQARNLGIKESCGKYVCFVDGDDFIHSKMLETLYNIVITDKTGIVCCGYKEDKTFKYTDEQFNKIKSKIYSINEKTLIELRREKGIYWTVWAKLIKRNILVKNLFTEGKIYEDNAIVPKWLIKAKRISIIEERLYYYQINENGTTKQKFNLRKLDYLWCLQYKCLYYKKKNYKRILAIEFEKYFNWLIRYCKKLREIDKNELADKQVKEFLVFSKKNEIKVSLRKRIILLVFKSKFLTKTAYCLYKKM